MEGGPKSDHPGQDGDLSFIPMPTTTDSYIVADESSTPFRGVFCFGVSRSILSRFQLSGVGSAPSSGITSSANEFLSKRGLGWLLELDEAEEENNQSILYVATILFAANNVYLSSGLIDS